MEKITKLQSQERVANQLFATFRDVLGILAATVLAILKTRHPNIIGVTFEPIKHGEGNTLCR